MSKLRRTLGAQHHFVTAYSPWANGTAEVMNRQLLRCLRAILVERQWASVLPVVQAALNHQPADRLGDVAPVTAFTAFTGLPATRPLDALFSALLTEEVIEEELVEKVGVHMRETALALNKINCMVKCHRPMTRGVRKPEIGITRKHMCRLQTLILATTC